MTVTPEMREAFWRTYKGIDCVTVAYLAMRDLDPEVAELRRKVADHDAVCIALGMEIRALRDEGSADEAFLAFQGYTRGEDGTWSATLAKAVAELRELTAHADLEAELAALHEFLRGQGYAKGEDGTWGKK